MAGKGGYERKKKKKEEEEEAKGIKNDSRGQNGKRRRSNEKMKVSDFF